MCETKDYENEMCIEYYRNLRERFTSQGDRLWLRFRYFLTIEAAIFGAFVLKPELLKNTVYLLGIPVFGFLWSILWYIISINDLWFYEERYKALEKFEENYILQNGGITRYKMTKEELPSWKRVFCQKFKKCGSTTFSAIIPFIFILVWVALGLTAIFTNNNSLIGTG